MERPLKLRTRDGHAIYGTLSRARKKAKSAMVFIHGLTGHQNEHLLHASRAYFPKKGVDACTFNLYDWRGDARKLDTCTLSDHVADTQTVLDHLHKKRYKRIFLVGHSLGGPVALLANHAHVHAVVLWDPTYAPQKGLKKEIRYDAKRDQYSIQWGTKVLLGKRFYQELMALDCEALAREVRVPLKAIAAGKGALVEGARKYVAAVPKPKALCVIPGATHCFDEEGAQERVLEETLQWVRRHT